MAGSRIPSAETFIISVFFLGVALWAVNKCTQKRTEIVAQVHEFATQDEEAPDQPTVRKSPKTEPAPLKPIEKPAVQQEPAPDPAPKPSVVPGRQPSKSPAAAAAPAATQKTAADKGASLYVVIDGLKVRGKPGLEGPLVTRLKLHEQVTFLNEKTEWTQKISLGTESVTDHWVRIRTASGQEGWVFGAGVHYYKMKRGE